MLRTDPRVATLSRREPLESRLWTSPCAIQSAPGGFGGNSIIWSKRNGTGNSIHGHRSKPWRKADPRKET